MKDIKKYQGVIPAFYACYDAEGNISVEGVKALTRHLIAKGVKGVYVGGSSGECIYQHVDERKAVLAVSYTHLTDPEPLPTVSFTFYKKYKRITPASQETHCPHFGPQFCAEHTVLAEKPAIL